MSLILGILFTTIDLGMYLHHRLDEASSRLDYELAEITRWLERRRADYLETFYLVPITRLSISPSIAAVLQAQYRALSLN